MRRAVVLVAAAAAASVLALGAAPPRGARLELLLPGETVHNAHYLRQSLLYMAQTALEPRPGAPSLDALVTRDGRRAFLPLAGLPAAKAELLLSIARAKAPADALSLDEMKEWMKGRYYGLTKPSPTLDALLRENPYRGNPDWLVVPVESATFEHRRVLRVAKDRVADALADYFANGDRLRFREGTVIVAESVDQKDRYMEAEVLRKRGDGFWNFSVYDGKGALVSETLPFHGDGVPSPDKRGFSVPDSCASCHRMDRLDLSGDPEPPVRAPIRAFFHRLPARIREIPLAPEYLDHAAFTELTETNAKAKDGVFGTYGSLLLSELAGRSRLGTLTASDRARYARLAPLYPEVLPPLAAAQSFTSSTGTLFVRIPPQKGLVGSPDSDPDRCADEARHPAEIPRPIFMAATVVTNGEYRKFRPTHRVAPYRGVALDADDRPAVMVSQADAAAFAKWLSEQPAEKAAGRVYRLPTEEEWELAARGGDLRRFAWGDAWPPPPMSANVGDETEATVFTKNWPVLKGYADGFVGTSPVNAFPPNPYFLHDMAGNVYQWTSSRYEPYPGAPRAKGAHCGEPPAYGAGFAVARGSSWADEMPKVIRAAFRNPLKPETRWPFLGFRLVAEVAGAR